MQHSALRSDESEFNDEQLEEDNWKVSSFVSFCFSEASNRGRDRACDPEYAAIMDVHPKTKGRGWKSLTYAFRYVAKLCPFVGIAREIRTPKRMERLRSMGTINLLSSNSLRAWVVNFKWRCTLIFTMIQIRQSSKVKWVDISFRDWIGWSLRHNGLNGILADVFTVERNLANPETRNWEIWALAERYYYV